MCSAVPPASASTARTFLRACSNWGTSLSLWNRCAASHPTWPAMNTRRPAGASIPLAYPIGGAHPAGSKTRIDMECSSTPSCPHADCESSVSPERGPLLVHEAQIGALVVLGLHADGLRLRLGLDGVIDAHVPFLVDALLGHGVSKGRPVGERLRRRLRVGEH